MVYFRDKATKASMALLPGDLTVLIVAVVLAHGPWLFLNIFSAETDYLVQYRWATSFSESISQGVLRPIWVPESRGGLGDPAFLYYMPLFFYATALVDAAVGDVWLAMKIVCAATAIGSGALAMSFARAEGLGTLPTRLVGVMAVALPVFLVLRNYINAYPWFFATFLILLAVIALVRYLQTPGRVRAVLLALAVGALCMTHALGAASFLLTAGAAICCDWLASDRSLRGLGQTCRAVGLLILGVGLSAVFLLPAVADLPLISSGAWDHEDPRFSTWWNSFILPVWTPVARGIYSFVLPWGTVALVPFVALAAWSVLPKGAEGQPIRILLWMAGLSLFMASELSFPLWETIEPLQIFQRPFRFVPPATAALLVAGVLLVARRQTHPVPGSDRAWQRGMLAAAALALAPAVLVLADSARDVRRGPASVPVAADMRAVFGQPEHMPATTGPDWSLYLENGGLAAECAAIEATCTGGGTTSRPFSWTVSVPTASAIRLPLMAFPAWAVTVNGVSQPLAIDARTGLVAPRLEEGTNLIEVRWRDLPSQTWGRAITIASFIILASLLFLRRRERGSAPHIG